MPHLHYDDDGDDDDDDLRVCNRAKNANVTPRTFRNGQARLKRRPNARWLGHLGETNLPLVACFIDA